MFRVGRGHRVGGVLWPYHITARCEQLHTPRIKLSGILGLTYQRSPVAGPKAHSLHACLTLAKGVAALGLNFADYVTM